MKAKHRKILRELMICANTLGGELDGTSTSDAKFRDRQRAHRYTYRIILAVLSDHPDNDTAEDDWQTAEKALTELKGLCEKQYGDKTGFK